MFKIEGMLRNVMHVGSIKWDNGELTGDETTLQRARWAYDDHRGQNVYDPMVSTAHLDHLQDEYCSWHILCSLFSKFTLVEGGSPVPPYEPTPEGAVS